MLGIGFPRSKLPRGLSRPPAPVEHKGVEAGRVARGGDLNRKSDSASGHQVMWEGYSRMVVGAKTPGRVVKMGSGSTLYPYRESRTGPPKS